MDNIPFTQPRTLTEAALFLQKHGKIVAKPISGAGARDIHIVTSASQLQSLHITGYILEKYIAGKELRYLVLNGAVIGVHESEYGISVEETRALKRISYAEEMWDPALVLSSIKTTRVLDLKFAAVDYLIDDIGHAYILEVNSTPGLKWFHAPTSGPVVDVARLFFESILNDSSNQETVTASTLGKHPLSVYS
jgi:glutathione synthase/RimK-type ligase-like ATP-grasp enzyme